MRSYWLIPLVLLVVGCQTEQGYPRMPETLISRDQAITIAERFVINNGYTDQPATLPPDQVVFESLEWSHDVGEILRSRSGTLIGKAVGAVSVEGGWIVGFRYQDDRDKRHREAGRGVTMDARGQHVRMQHEDFFLKELEQPKQSNQ